MNKIFIIVDLEATCWENSDVNKPVGFKNEIIEIGAVKCDEHGNILDEFCKFLKPKVNSTISEFCTNLTTITQEDIDNADDAGNVLMLFFQWAYKEVQVHEDEKDVTFISWGHYDKNQFRDDLRLNGLDTIVINDNNHKSLKHLHQDWNKLKKGIGLGWACKFEKIEFTGTAHRGIDDARNIVKIFRKYLDKF